MDPRLLSKLSRMYPSCTHRELEELASSIEGEKYWGAGKDLVFAVALTRARLVRGSTVVAEATHFGRVGVPQPLQQFCRKGRILLLSTGGSPQAVAVFGWPAFLWMMRKEKVQQVVRGVLSGDLKAYIGVPKLREYLRLNERDTLAGPSGIGPETPGFHRPR